ncbi:hypothetical protein PoB_002264300 [Plakobranchus ocellatus]|uniref:Uncharacterized protein n=1 Tax=Plakobranchus ocellatus TaxID=259542 RepID=A0AAV3ZMS5_9GAST|nr:hypothetical protein PoB_002264300 [Plakobranchus ocellatus]
MSFSNPMISSKDADLPSSSRQADAEQGSKWRSAMADDPNNVQTLQLECLEEEDEQASLVFKNGRSRPGGSKLQETNVDSVEDILQKDSQNMGAVAPGYTDSDLSKEMLHLDNQLKAAFRLTQDSSKAAVPETDGIKPAATTTSTFEFNKNDDFSKESGGATVAPTAVVTAPPPIIKAQESVQDKENTSNKAERKGTIPIAHEDIESILKIRKKVKKLPPSSVSPQNVRSRPDLIPREDENIIAIKRVHIRAPGDRRKVYLSSQ